MINAADLPVMLYGVPHRTGTVRAPATLRELSAHPNIHAVKDAQADLLTAGDLIATCSLAWYCGIDDLNLPYLSVGGTGVVWEVRFISANRASRRNAIRAMPSSVVLMVPSESGSGPVTLVGRAWSEATAGVCFRQRRFSEAGSRGIRTRGAASNGGFR